jgi:hypothetical protein
LYTSLRFFLGISMMTECCLSTTSARLEGWLSTLEGRADGTETREEMRWVSRRSSEPSGVRLANAGTARRPSRSRPTPGPVAPRARRETRGARRGRVPWRCARGKGRRGGEVRGARLAATGARRPAPPPARSRGARRAAVSLFSFSTRRSHPLPRRVRRDRIASGVWAFGLKLNGRFPNQRS